MAASLNQMEQTMFTSIARNNAIARLCALCAAVVVSALSLGSQLGLSAHYTSKADTLMAAKRAAPVAQNAASALAPGRRS